VAADDRDGYNSEHRHRGHRGGATHARYAEAGAERVAVAAKRKAGAADAEFERDEKKVRLRVALERSAIFEFAEAAGRRLELLPPGAGGTHGRHERHGGHAPRQGGELLEAAQPAVPRRSCARRSRRRARATASR
jgi:hypothetical protein